MYLGKLQYRRSPRRNHKQSGYMLIVVIFLMVGLMIAALATGPSIAQQIKRDREVEMVHRGVEYARAVKRYYKKFGRYPPTLEALEDTNHIRFLRKRYKDPLTEDGKWQVVRFGQVQMNATARQGGTGGLLGGGTGLPNVPGVTGLLTGQNSPAGQQLGNTTNPTGTGTSSTGTANKGGTTDTSGSTSTTLGSSFGQSSSAGGGQTFGGGAIIGVASMSEQESLRVVDDKNHYKDWKFVYDPTLDRGLINGPYDPKKQMGQFGNQQPVGQPVGQQPGTSTPSTGNTFGQQQNPTGQPYQQSSNTIELCRRKKSSVFVVRRAGQSSCAMTLTSLSAANVAA
jgi:type II secretory pathway pseudopilin PulG